MRRQYKSVQTDKLLQKVNDSFDIINTSVAAKIKRLKIEESHLLKTLNSTIYTNVYDGNINDNQVSDYHKLICDLKELYENINTIYGDIKGSISSQEAIRSLDISDMEGNICGLEEKIKYLKNYMQLQMSPLKVDEKLLTEELKQNPSEIWIKSDYKSQGQKYKEVVPSPVRVLITSSLKSLEVQEFQDFISNSRNRFGGWNEYHHNIFVTCWKKYFQTDNRIETHGTDCENFIRKIEKSKYFQPFLQEIHRKLECFKTDEIIAHSKWYSRYVYLKERQQTAIMKWKTNKSLIKKSTTKVVHDAEITSPKCAAEPITDQDEMWNRSNSDLDVINGENKDQINNNIIMDKRQTMARGCDKNCPRLQYDKPTKQWLSRSQTIESSSEFCSSNVENLTKLRIPNWRIGLQSYKGK